MLRLQKNQATNLALTLKEKTTVTDYYPLFRFIQQDGNKEYLFHLSQSFINDRYDLFSITTTMNLGSYYYEVYQSLTDSDEDYTNMVQLEIGKAEVYE